MRSNTSLLGEGFIMDRLRLEILTRILNKIFNYNLFRVLRVFRGFFGGCFARNLWGKSLIKYGLWPEINHHRNLNGY